jgi:hypothetical protein
MQANLAQIKKQWKPNHRVVNGYPKRVIPRELATEESTSNKSAALHKPADPSVV